MSNDKQIVRKHNQKIEIENQFQISIINQTIFHRERFYILVNYADFLI